MGFGTGIRLGRRWVCCARMSNHSSMILYGASCRIHQEWILAAVFLSSWIHRVLFLHTQNTPLVRLPWFWCILASEYVEFSDLTCRNAVAKSITAHGSWRRIWSWSESSAPFVPLSGFQVCHCYRVLCSWTFSPPSTIWCTCPYGSTSTALGSLLQFHLVVNRSLDGPNGASIRDLTWKINNFDPSILNRNIEGLSAVFSSSLPVDPCVHSFKDKVGQNLMSFLDTSWLASSTTEPIQNPCFLTRSKQMSSNDSHTTSLCIFSPFGSSSLLGLAQVGDPGIPLAVSLPCHGE